MKKSTTFGLWICAILFITLLATLAVVFVKGIVAYYSDGYTSEKILVTLVIFQFDVIICYATAQAKKTITTVGCYITSACVSFALMFVGALSFVGISAWGFVIFYNSPWPTFIGGFTMGLLIVWLYLYQGQTFMNFLNEKPVSASVVTG